MLYISSVCFRRMINGNSGTGTPTVWCHLLSLSLGTHVCLYDGGAFENLRYFGRLSRLILLCRPRVPVRTHPTKDERAALGSAYPGGAPETCDDAGERDVGERTELQRDGCDGEDHGVLTLPTGSHSIG